MRAKRTNGSAAIAQCLNGYGGSAVSICPSKQLQSVRVLREKRGRSIYMLHLGADIATLSLVLLFFNKMKTSQCV